MDQVRISDVTMKQTGKEVSFSLTFKEKLELAKLLDRLGVSVIELEGIEHSKIDSLRIKSVASAVKHSVVAVPVRLEAGSVPPVWQALREARFPRLQVCAAVSPVQMEYLFHKKPDAMLKSIRETVAACRECASDVEFIADDATRSDPPFLYSALNTAIEAGANTVTVCDAAGAMLPDEFADFIDRLYQNVPELSGVTLGVNCSDALSMADACAVAAARRGAREIKAAAYRVNAASLPNVSRVLSDKGEGFGIRCGVRLMEMKRITSQIAWMCQTGRSKNSPFDNGVREGEEGVSLTSHDDMASVLKAVNLLGYDLSEEDGIKVWEGFQRIAERKDEVGLRELDAIVAAEAMQVPPTYEVESYVINTGNIISAMAHMRVKRQGKPLEGMAVGGGAIDAAFLAIEQITGRHYELDDFQIQAVTQGREAMGQTVVKLRSDGKVYPGRGISTDIVGASIMAYINALNKIAYEEEDA